MSERLVDRFPFAKIVTVLAVAFGIGLGLCGLSAVWSSPGLGVRSLLIMVLSLVGLVSALILWAIMSVIGGFSAKNSAPQTLFGNPDEDLDDRDEAP